MPAVKAVTLSAGSTWLTADNGAALFDGKPARVTRIGRSAHVTITVTLARPIVPGVIALLGLNVPAGTGITTAGANGVARLLPDGTVCAYLLPARAAPVSNVAVGVGGVGVLQIGELVIMPTVDVPHTSDWSSELIDPSSTNRTVASQVDTTRRQPYRQLTANLTPAGIEAARGGGLADGLDWERLTAALAQDRRCVAIPRWTTGSGAVDATEVARTAVYGVGRLGPIQHLGGDYYGSSILVAEVPATA